MDATQHLQALVKQRKKARPDRIIRLGDAVTTLVEKQISPRQQQLELLYQTWIKLLPVELGRHCKIIDFCDGKLTVRADSPSYMYELRMCSPQIKTELNRQCRRVNIKKIKFVLV